MKKINIKGKEYVEVNERVIHLRKNFGTKDNMFGINTQVYEWDKENKEIIIRAWITDKNDKVVGSGIAHESQHDKSSFVNATSYVENCETSAIGRALAAMGIGIEDAYASADEVNRAIEQREAKSEKKSQDKSDDLIEQMENSPRVWTVDEVKLELCNVFVESSAWTGAMTHQRDQMLENLTREDTTDMEEFDIKDFAIANPGNKQKLKNFSNVNMKEWQKLPQKDYDELVAFMNYLNKKFEKEDV